MWPEWMLNAACRGTPHPEVWFPPPRAAAAALSIAVCSGCPVREVCGDYALRHRLNYGVWGGMTERQRRAERERRRASAS